MTFLGELLGSAAELLNRNGILLDAVNGLVPVNAEGLLGSVKHAGPVPLLVATFIAAVGFFYLVIRGCAVLIRCAVRLQRGHWDTPGLHLPQTLNPNLPWCLQPL